MKIIVTTVSPVDAVTNVRDFKDSKMVLYVFSQADDHQWRISCRPFKRWDILKVKVIFSPTNASHWMRDGSGLSTSEMCYFFETLILSVGWGWGWETWCHECAAEMNVRRNRADWGSSNPSEKNRCISMRSQPILVGRDQIFPHKVDQSVSYPVIQEPQRSNLFSLSYSNNARSSVRSIRITPRGIFRINNLFHIG